MGRFLFHTREIGAVSIFDLVGTPRPETEQEEVQDLAWRMQKNIRRHRLQRVILNMKGVEALEAVSMRKIIAACMRPKQSVIYGATHDLLRVISENHLPQNIGVCSTEREVTEKLGTFLFDKNEAKYIPRTEPDASEGIGVQIERRRSHRMHVALPLEIKVVLDQAQPLITTSIATNISEGGLFAEYLDLDAAHKMESAEIVAGKKVHIHIFPSAYFPSEFDVNGIVRRKELRGKQLGLGIEFLS